MLPITTPAPAHHHRVHDLVAVFRLVSVPSAQLPALLQGAATERPVLPLRTHGRFELVTGFSAVPGVRGRWRARARLHGRGLRLVPYARVDIEITPWSPDASELRLRPVSRSPHAWGIGRLRRYLRLAPVAADALVDHLAELAHAASTSLTATASPEGPAPAALPGAPAGSLVGPSPIVAARSERCAPAA
jgi:hypothetical protein